MAMSIGGNSGKMSDINITPMIDILLVLLIIFMVIVPVTPKGLAALVPRQSKTSLPTPVETIVVQVFCRPGQSPAYKINNVDVNHAELLSKLTDIYANRAERVMFVKGDENVEFRYVADVIDIGKAANVDRIGLMTPKIQAGI
jgi:biopolymer transport protein ExbD